MPEDAQIAKIVREYKGLTQAELADKVGVTVPTISRFERGDHRVKSSTRARIAEELGLSFDWISQKILPPAGIPLAAFEPRNGHSLPDSLEPVDFPAPVPEWTIDISASTWVHVPLCELDANDPEQRRVIESGRFRLRIIGACMAPEYLSGQTIEFEIVRVDQASEIGHDYIICRTDGQATFKRLVQVDVDTISLMALNQRDYPGLIVVAKQEIGRVARVVYRLSPPPPPYVPKLPKPSRGRR